MENTLFVCTLTFVGGLQSYLDQSRLYARQSRRLLMLRPGCPHAVEAPRYSQLE